MNEELASRLTEILGRRVIVTTECGVGVLCAETMQFLLSTSRVPKTLTAEWLARAIERRQRTAAGVKERREAAKAALVAHLTAKGVPCDGMNIYFTATGFSVCNFFRNGIAEAERIIRECGIEPKRLEYSQAHWVVRVIL